VLVGHPELDGTMRHEAPDLDEATGIQQAVDALASREFARCVLLLNASVSTASQRCFVTRDQSI
jgi:hypothetical protein